MRTGGRRIGMQHFIVFISASCQLLSSRVRIDDPGRYTGNIYKSQNILIHTCVIDKITLFPVRDIPAYRIFRP